MITILVLWAIFGFAIHLFANQLNEWTLFNLPLGYFMAGQGSLIVFIVLIFWFARAQHGIDRDVNVSEMD